MKSYRHLWDEIISSENIEAAIIETCSRKSRKNRRKIQKLEALRRDPDRIEKVRNWILTYETKKKPPKEIYDGISRKKRKIFVPSVGETVIEHCVVRVLDKYLGKGVYDHAYAAIKGRGAHKAKKRLKAYIRKGKGVKYYLKMDIKQYFPSVDQKVLMAMLARKIKDYRTLELIRKIIETVDDGIPLGYYISQWIANFYLRELDAYIKQELKCKIYLRWMDDMAVFGSNKRKLSRIREAIAEKLADYGLTMKGNWKICRFSYGESREKKKSQGCFLDYMGFRFYRNRITLRESIFYKMTKKARRLSKKEKPTLHDLRQFLSYLGWIKHSDTYDAYLAYVKPYINIQYVKRRISRHDRKENKNVKSNIQAREGLLAAG